MQVAQKVDIVFACASLSCTTDKNLSTDKNSTNQLSLYGTLLISLNRNFFEKHQFVAYSWILHERMFLYIFQKLPFSLRIRLRRHKYKIWSIKFNFIWFPQHNQQTETSVHFTSLNEPQTTCMQNTSADLALDLRFNFIADPYFLSSFNDEAFLASDRTMLEENYSQTCQSQEIAANC